MSQVIGYPNVGRFGLTHSLLAWARCHLWCSDRRLEMLAPSWLHLRVGPYLRRERDKRAYHRLFHFPDYTTGIRRLVMLATLPRVNAEDGDLADLPQNERRLVVFNNRWSQNEDYHFHHLVGRGAEVRAALERITKRRYLPESARAPHIAVHIRMGDFKIPASLDAVRAGETCARLPLSWYVEMVQGLRSHLGRELAVKLYSDGRDDDLAPVLALPCVERVQPRSAITDLLALAQADVLVSSGSGFSYWGGYLGDVPRVCFPGQRHYRVLGGAGPVDREPECESGAEIPAAFIRYVQQRLERGR